MVSLCRIHPTEICLRHFLKNTKAMEKHDILHEFPQFKDRVHELKTSNHHFRKLFDDYHEVDHEIHSIETGATTAIDEYLNELRKKRVHLKDSIFEILNAASN
jgi:uncharacterized protein YdcH (DUF465 family)